MKFHYDKHKDKIIQTNDEFDLINSKVQYIPLKLAIQYKKELTEVIHQKQAHEQRKREKTQ